MDAHELHIQLDPAKRASDDIYEQLRALITSGALKPGDRICTIGGLYGTQTVADSISTYDITMLTSIAVYLIPTAFLLRKKKLPEVQLYWGAYTKK